MVTFTTVKQWYQYIQSPLIVWLLKFGEEWTKMIPSTTDGDFHNSAVYGHNNRNSHQNVGIFVWEHLCCSKNLKTFHRIMKYSTPGVTSVPNQIGQGLAVRSVVLVLVRADGVVVRRTSESPSCSTSSSSSDIFTFLRNFVLLLLWKLLRCGTSHVHASRNLTSVRSNFATILPCFLLRTSEKKSLKAPTNQHCYRVHSAYCRRCDLALYDHL